MLSSVSKLADKTFVIGFFLPVLIFLIAFGALFAKPLGFDQWFSALHSNNPFANLTYFALLVWMGAVLLLALNHWLYRLYEGYLFWPWFRDRFIAVQKWRKRGIELVREHLKDVGKASESYERLWSLKSDFPYSDEFVLATAFGNRIRAFELYSEQVYAADAIPTWWRLLAVIPNGFKSEIEDARAQVNFFLNLSALSWVFALFCVGRLIWNGVIFHTWIWNGESAQYLFACIIAIALAVWAYYCGCAAIPAWGEAVKAAFDCYLPTLAGQLGYQLPEPESDRRRFWEDFSRLFLYREQLIDGKWKPRAPTALSETRPSNRSQDGSDGGSDDDDEEDADGQDAHSE